MAAKFGIGTIKGAEKQGRWFQVIIQDPNSDVADDSASGLLNKFSPARRAKRLLPDDAPVFHGKTKTSDYVFFFSSAAAEIAKDIFRQFSATMCPKPSAEDPRSLTKA